MNSLIALHGQYILIDEYDYYDLCQYTWRVMPNGYVIRSANQRRSDGSWLRTNEYIHRRILKIPTGNRHIMVDHINGDKKNNRRHNLRICNNGQNQCNSRIKITNKTGYKGVIWNKGAYQASITTNKKHYYLGRFTTAEDAYHVYCDAATEIHGDFFKG